MLDVAHDKVNDVATPLASQDIERALGSGRVLLLGEELPCKTLSRARRAPPGSAMPGPLRGSSGPWLWGLPNLPPRDAAKVKQSNFQIRAFRRRVFYCIKHDITGYAENPRTSLLWKFPWIRNLERNHLIKLTHCEMCAYGTPWRKATTFMTWGPGRDIELKRCIMKNKVCFHTGKPHIVLTGASRSGFKTEAAQVYPQPLADHLLAQLLANIKRAGQAHHAS